MVSCVYLNFTNSVIENCLLCLILIGLISLKFVYRKYYFSLGLIGFVFFCLGYLLFSVNTKVPLSDGVKLNKCWKGKVSSVTIGEKWNRVIVETKGYIDTNDSVFTERRKVLIYLESDKIHPNVNDAILFKSKLQEVRNKNNPGEFNSEQYWLSKGVRLISFVKKGNYKVLQSDNFSCIKKANELRDFLSCKLEKVLNGDELALAKALILGDKQLLGQDVKQSFGKSGGMHVLAVSGLHIGIVLQILLFLFERIPRVFSKNTALIVAIVLLWGYGVLTGLSPSVIRSVFMFSILALTKIYGDREHTINSLFFSAFVLLFINPYFLFDIGFQLSYLAMLGIYIFYPMISKLHYFKNKLMLKVWQGTAVGIAAQLLTTPLTLYYFHQFPNYFILTNIFLMLVVGWVLICGVSYLSMFWLPYLGKGVGVLLFFLLFFMLKVVFFVANLPGAIALGYEFSVVIVLLLYVIVFLWFIFKDKSWIHHVLIPLSLSILVFITYSRFEKSTVSELCFFNTNIPVFMWKKNGKVICFSEDTSEKNDLKIQRLIADFLKIYPGELAHFKLERDGSVNIDGERLYVKRDKFGYSIDFNGKKFFLQLKESKTSCKDRVVVRMPWIESSGLKSYTLKDGARIFRGN